MAPITGTLEADVVTTIELGPRVYEVTVTTDGEIWFTTDGSEPYEGSPVAHHLLSYQASLTVPVGGGNEEKQLKLWSDSTPTYTVTVGDPQISPFTALDHAITDHADLPGVPQSGAPVVPIAILGANPGGLFNAAVQTTHPYLVDVANDFFTSSGSASFLVKVDPGGFVATGIELATLSVPPDSSANFSVNVVNLDFTERLVLSGNTPPINSDGAYSPALEVALAASIGTDLSLVDGDVVSEAGGIFQVAIGFLHSND